MRPVLRLVPTIAVCLALVACAGATAETQGDPVRVVASFYPLAYAAERLGGAQVAVTDLTPPGVEPQDLELSADDLEAIAGADVVIFLGGGFQPAVQDAVGTEATGAVLDVAMSQGSRDPHVWLDPSRYADIVTAIAAVLARRDIDVAPAAASLAGDLHDLDASFRRGLAGCAGDLLITNHAAFGYLASAYGLRDEAISGLSPESEPDPAHLADLSAQIRAEGVTTIFTEALVPPDVAQTLAAEAGVAVVVLDPLEGLSRDRIDAGENYLSVMRDDLATLREGLGC